MGVFSVDLFYQSVDYSVINMTLGVGIRKIWEILAIFDTLTCMVTLTFDIRSSKLQYGQHNTKRYKLSYQTTRYDEIIFLVYAQL